MDDLGETERLGIRWHEYPIGMGAEWANALSVLVLPFLGGVFVSLVSMVAIGVVGEEGVITDLLARWIPLNQAQDVSENLDLLLRISILPVGAFVYLGVLVLALADTAVAFGVSKALLTAAQGDADRHLVPPPSQMWTVERDPLESIRIFAKGNLFVGGIAVSMLMLFVAVEASVVGFIVAAVVAAYTVCLWLGIKRLQTRLSGGRGRVASRVAAHWTEEAENAARAMASKKPASAGDGDVEGAPGGRRRALARTFVVLPGVLAFIAAFFMQIGLSLRHPGSTKYHLAGREEYGAAGEVLLNGIWWTMLGLVAVALLMILAAAILAQSGTSAMERWLRDRAAEPTATAPPYRVLLKFSERQGVPAVRGLGFVAGPTLVFGTGLVLLSAFDMGGFADIYSGSDEIFGGYLAPTLGAIGATLLLSLVCLGVQVWQTVSEREFRNLLHERWPVRPPGVGQRKSDEVKKEK